MGQQNRGQNGHQRERFQNLDPREANVCLGQTVYETVFEILEGRHSKTRN